MKPSRPKPANNMAQDSGSGTAETIIEPLVAPTVIVLPVPLAVAFRNSNPEKKPVPNGSVLVGSADDLKLKSEANSPPALVML
jgi:hypothetical protein